MTDFFGSVSAVQQVAGVYPYAGAYNEVGNTHSAGSPVISDDNIEPDGLLIGSVLPASIQSGVAYEQQAGCSASSDCSNQELGSQHTGSSKNVQGLGRVEAQAVASAPSSEVFDWVTVAGLSALLLLVGLTSSSWQKHKLEA